MRRLPPPSGLANCSLVLKLGVVVGHGGEGVFFGGVERNDVVVKMFDENFSVFRFHGGEETRERKTGIGRPVSVVAAVERANRAVGGDLQAENAAIAEEYEGAAALMDGAVGGDE